MRNNTDNSTNDGFTPSQRAAIIAEFEKLFKKVEPGQLRQYLSKFAFSFIAHQCATDGINKDELNAMAAMELLHDTMNTIDQFITE